MGKRAEASEENCSPTKLAVGLPYPPKGTALLRLLPMLDTDRLRAGRARGRNDQCAVRTPRGVMLLWIRAVERFGFGTSELVMAAIL